ncbi:cytochrome c [Flavobacterium sp. Root420]|uniref:cytochrome c n=1 Tax=Flavobacterium sp. Root420 TaxID=1736533 RepID=UPI0006F68559|nr:cytochrome c [Flavobacterium sp. Root420]KQX15938.1 cytochrome C [Flavobacterium sp. Root420]
MKVKILTLAAVTLVAVSCGTKKTASTPDTPAVTVMVKAEELTPELAAGKSMYENSCVKCHKLYEPKKFTQEEWAPILVRMQKKAHLDDVQMASVTSYIHSQL